MYSIDERNAGSLDEIYGDMIAIEDDDDGSDKIIVMTNKGNEKQFQKDMQIARRIVTVLNN